MVGRVRDMNDASRVQHSALWRYTEREDGPSIDFTCAHMWSCDPLRTWHVLQQDVHAVDSQIASSMYCTCHGDMCLERSPPLAHLAHTPGRCTGCCWRYQTHCQCSQRCGCGSGAGSIGAPATCVSTQCTQGNESVTHSASDYIHSRMLGVCRCSQRCGRGSGAGSTEAPAAFQPAPRTRRHKESVGHTQLPIPMHV